MCLGCGQLGDGRFCCVLRVKLFTQHHIKIRMCGLQKIHDSLSKKASSLLRKEKRARVSSFFFLSPSLSLSSPSLTLSLGFIYVCNQNCPVFTPPSDDIFYSDFIAMVTLTL